MAFRIYSVGFEIPGEDDSFIGHGAKHVLGEADIILFDLDLSYVALQGTEKDGIQSLDLGASRRAADLMTHWRTELRAAFELGKTIVVFLSSVVEFEAHASAFQASQETLPLVPEGVKYARLTNYHFLPWDLGPISSVHGQEIRVARDLQYFAEYWREFGPHSRYEVTLDAPPHPTVLTTAGRERSLGVVIHGTKGAALLIPPILYDRDEFVQEDEDSDDFEEIWTDEAIAFGQSLVEVLVRIHRHRLAGTDITPPPEWVAEARYLLSSEIRLGAEIEQVIREISDLQAQQSMLELQLVSEGMLKCLLYEKGQRLEEAVRIALNILEFNAEAFHSDDMEFDVVFTSDEGRLIGEVEGKDNSAINVDKMGQLERVIQEDFARPEVDSYAKPVLFGNAYRLTPPTDRADFFTVKCLSAAQRAHAALVRTTDLFLVAKYLREHNASEYARACRQAIAEADGTIVVFPELPPD